MRDLKLSFTDVLEGKEKWLMADTLCNGCFAMDKKTGNIEHLFSFEGESPVTAGLYYQIYPYGRELFFVPGYARSICAWNPDTNKQTVYPITKKEKMPYRYVDSCRIDNKIWLFPASLSQPVVLFDLERRTVEFWNDYTDGQPDEIKNRTGEVFFRQYVIRGAKAYAVLHGSPYLVCFDLQEKVFSVKQIAGKEYAFNDVGYGRDSFWFAQKGSYEVLRWHPQTEERETYRWPDLADGPGAGYSNVIGYQERIFLVPFTGTKILEASPAKKELEVFCELPQDLGCMKDERKGWRRFYSCRSMGGRIRLYPNQADLMVDIHVAEKYACGQSYQISEAWYRDVFQKQLLPAWLADKFSKDNGEIQENGLVDLEAYVSYIEQREPDERTAERVNYGERIHRALL
ncbi:MAG: hypothetical protein HFI39_05300 [Lachnospiraceae bacterium]|nr:hypothetical protein [Lachnospiraceae bacterium]